MGKLFLKKNYKIRTPRGNKELVSFLLRGTLITQGYEIRLSLYQQYFYLAGEIINPMKISSLVVGLIK